MKKLAFIVICLFYNSITYSQTDIYDLSLEELLSMEVSVASKEHEKINDAAGIISVLTNKEIENFGALNLGELLNRITSMYHLQGGMLPFNVASMRAQHNGVFDNHILILLNGRPLRDASSGGFNNVIYNSFPIGMIDRIEIIRGPGSALYGSNAFSGVLNIVTKLIENDGLAAKNCFTTGSFETIKDQICGIYSKNYLKLNFAAEISRDKGEFYQYYDASKTLGSANYEKDGESLFLNAEYKNFKADFLYLNFVPFYIGNKILWKNAGEIESMNRLFGNLTHQAHFTEKLELESNLTYNGFEWNPENAKSYSLLLELILKFNPTEKIHLIAASVNDFSDWTGSDFSSGTSFQSNIYAQFTYDAFSFLKIIGGFQLNNIGNTTQHLSPRVGLVSNFTKHIGAKILYSNAFRNPYPTETRFLRDNVVGNPDLLPEKINTIETQAFYQNTNFQVSLTYYNSEMTDIITKKRNPVTGKGEFLNLLEHNFWGLEFESKLNLIQRISFFTSATYQENKNSLEQKNATYVPNVMAKIGVFYNCPRVVFGVFDSYFGEPTQSNELLPATAQIPELNIKPTDFHLLSANLSLKLNSIFKIKGSTSFTTEFYVSNLLDKKIYFPEISVNAINGVPLYPGRAYFGKLIIKINR